MKTNNDLCQILLLSIARTITATLFIPACVNAQTASGAVEPIAPPVTCDAPAVTLRVLALERGSPGELRMEVDFESEANVTQKISIRERDTFLVDDTGYQYKIIQSPREMPLLPSTKTRASYVFLSEVGGKSAKSVNMNIRFYVRAARSGSKECTFTLRGIPIVDLRR